MWAHEHTEHQNRPVVRRAPRADAADVAPDAARVLALQRTVGNAAVAAAIGARSVAVQRVSQTDAAQADAGHAAAPAGEAQDDARRGPVIEREKKLTTRFGVRIGPPTDSGQHFTHALLDRIEAALRQLPIEDLRGNDKLQAIELDTRPDGNATLYDKTTQSVGVVKPVTPIGVRAPAWLYAALNMEKPWQLRFMDKGAMADYKGITKRGDRELGIPKGSRGVMTPQGSLLQWTIRHEVGHSVDQNIGWNLTLAQQDIFGGWRTYPDPSDRDVVATAILQRAQLHNVLPPNAVSSPVTSLSSILNPDTVREGVTSGRLDRFFNRYTPQATNLTADQIAERKATATRFVKLAIAQPWTLANGGEDTLDVNGRIYQMDQYENWVSYRANQRPFMVSRYQFSNPEEWFAEAYAAYYNNDRPELRELLNPQTLAWFNARPQPPAADDGQ